MLHGLRTYRPAGGSFSVRIFSQVIRDDRSGSAGTDPPLFLRRALEGGNHRSGPWSSSRHGEADQRSGAISSRRAVVHHDAGSLSSPGAPDAGSASAASRDAIASDAAGSRLPGQRRAVAAGGGAAGAATGGKV